MTKKTTKNGKSKKKSVVTRTTVNPVTNQACYTILDKKRPQAPKR